MIRLAYTGLLCAVLAVASRPVAGNANDLAPGPGAAGAPPETTARSWEAVPGVIRNDGIETFRVEVGVAGPVDGVIISHVLPALISLEGDPVTLHDDGVSGDRVAGDLVFTSALFLYNPAVAMADHYRNDAMSPAGLDAINVGTIIISDLDGGSSFFAVGPQVGVLRSDIPAVAPVALGAGIAVAPHLINVRSDALQTQRFLRFLGGDISSLTQAIYAVLPDVFDQLVLFSTNRIEQVPSSAGPNAATGLHSLVKVDYSGTGLPMMDDTAAFGSGGRLLGYSVLDAYQRGISSANATHELIHQWAAYIDPALGLTDGTGHYLARSSAGSLVGGFRWIDQGGGVFSVDCTDGANGSHQAAPLDLYFMGLLDGSAMPPLRVYDQASPVPPLRCGQPFDDVVTTVSVEQVQARHGERLPAPGAAPHDFNLGFVAESNDRMFNPTEMTYYDMLAAHYTALIPPEQPDPYIGGNWVSIERFFGPGVTWTSDVPQVPLTPAPTASTTPTPTRTAAATTTPATAPPATAIPTAIGDVNCDGATNSIDASLLLQYAAGVVTQLACQETSDVNGDGLANSLDALLVLQFDAGLLDRLGRFAVR